MLGKVFFYHLKLSEDPTNIEDEKVDVSFGIVKHKQASKSEEKERRKATTALSDTANGGRGSDKQGYLTHRVVINMNVEGVVHFISVEKDLVAKL
ncbi:hypothetical protein RHGRI_011062 [Rhododendron griersonianum]|uniref:Uncharacterized protein n=1 Tax=Rhododendron griersonianum TaxID=479676 RepID=A0AAV6KKI4_9ERIC|nr:hypothetical protein RHGRI_011062 [Rhododendron griersonianum]